MNLVLIFWIVYRPENYQKTSSKWLQPATLLIMTPYHKYISVNFKTFFRTTFTTKSMDSCFQIEKTTFLYPEFLEIMGILRVAITMSGIFPLDTALADLHLLSIKCFNKKRKKIRIEGLKSSIGCEIHIQVYGHTVFISYYLV